MNYSFVDLIRFFSMVSIVYLHTIGTFSILNNASFDTGYFWVLAPMKFGTICFYLISGFLLGDKIEQTPALTYFKRRLDNTFRPYIRTLICFTLFFSLSYFTGAHRVATLNEYFSLLANDFIEIILYTNYWFIINFFISLSIILLFKRYLFTYGFAIISFLITVVYCINIYVQYFEPRHTAAFFGFIFYLWLGIFINRYKREFIGFVDKIKFPVFLILSGMLIGFSVYESNVLQALNSVDPINTLKISNQLYSLVIFSLLVKCRNLELPRIFDPKKETFAIYLYHSFFITILFKIILLFASSPILNSEYLLIISFLSFIVIYLLTLLTVKCINKSSFKWSVEFKNLKLLQKA